eukprot:TRINITY_DN796_c0_g1_i1.p1 TRINITY_DN796_c0_g1~~TRINITY_DN796_c0_g1_i1.p1  ORF type:complete len:288 (-),score=-0.97 TRINITY_DN796_c0_g1_i1:96-959(-)
MTSIEQCEPLVGNNSRSVKIDNQINFLKIIGFIPVLLVFLIFGYIYFAFVFSIWSIETHLNTCQEIERIIGLVFFHIFMILALVSYIRTVFTDPGRVPPSYSPDIELGRPSEYKTCRKCQALKPPRAHHCSTCGRCVLRMDHHCPWVNNCVGWRNHKFFVLFLIWTAMTSCVVFGFTLLRLSEVGFHWVIDINFLITVLVSGTFGVALLLFSFQHLWLVRNNFTTLEVISASDCCSICSETVRSPYNMGHQRNFSQIFGERPLLWLFPILTVSGDGVHWEVEGANQV